MQKTFREKVVTTAAVEVKKHKILKPLILVCVVLILGGYYCVHHFYLNGKKYIAMLLAILFFTMSSSFSFPEMMSEEEIYLDQKQEGLQYIEEDEIALTMEEPTESEDAAWIDDSVLSEAEEKQLESTENIDKYTLDDFLEGYEATGNDKAKSEISLSSSDFDKDDWKLILINKQHPVPEDYEFPLTTIKGAMQCDERILDELLMMLQAAKNDGVNLIVCSPYRDYNRQKMLFNRKIDIYINNGLSYMEAYKAASTQVTVPGASEHQIGLALDIICDTYNVLNIGFGGTKAGQWLKENSAEFGFILRYPEGKEYITSIMYEPWHFRYVGVEAAKYMTDNELTLEEFVEGL